jgi:hypothetical protein
VISFGFVLTRTTRYLASNEQGLSRWRGGRYASSWPEVDSRIRLVPQLEGPYDLAAMAITDRHAQ